MFSVRREAVEILDDQALATRILIKSMQLSFPEQFKLQNDALEVRRGQIEQELLVGSDQLLNVVLWAT